MANEKRLIDAWKLVIDLARIKKCGEYDHKDCIYNETGGCEHSESADVGYSPNYFCADGERKEK